METHSPHNLPSEFQLDKVMDMDIGVIYFYGKIVVVELKEGITLSHKNGLSVLLKGLTIIGAKPWVYISNRIHSYSINPIDYKYLNKVPTLKAMAVVSYSEIGHRNTELESRFCKKPFRSFNNLTEAVIWGNGFLI